MPDLIIGHILPNLVYNLVYLKWYVKDNSFVMYNSTKLTSMCLMKLFYKYSSSGLPAPLSLAASSEKLSNSASAIFGWQWQVVNK